ncbi:unnamed protein product [Nyctereutes procyonoides]|uniref:(raccoon dog) hypothetical protein n=1 Tax=Nyctereutes procyonoides TaxID=34880 RepID=A0A811ZUJ5_NYCPR|nr:unnamed protein product [Nyctereutes procyonoides]
MNLTCSVPWACEQGIPPIFSWMSAALTSLGPRTHLSSVLTLTPRPQDHGTNLTCQVQFPAVGVMVERTIQLNVTYTQRDCRHKGTYKYRDTHSLLLQEALPALTVSLNSHPQGSLSTMYPLHKTHQTAL